MSEATLGTPPAATATPAAQTVPNAAQPPAAAAPRVTVDDLPPEALSARLEQVRRAERAAFLAELGVTDPNEVKAALADAKAKAEAQKTDAEKLAALNLRVAAQSEALTVAVSQAARSITAEQKAAVDAIAGNDPAVWMKTYAALAPTWGASVTAQAAPAPAAAQPATQPQATTPAATSAATPASTSPSGGAPAPGAPTQSPVDHAAVRKQLQAINPFAAARYANKFGDACFK